MVFPVYMISVLKIRLSVCVCVCVYCGEDTLDSGQMSVKVLVSFLEGPILMSLT